MISNQVLQKTVDGLGEISKGNYAVLDSDGTVLASTFDGAAEYSVNASQIADSPADSMVIGGNEYIKVNDADQLAYIALGLGDGSEEVTMTRILAFQLSQLVVAYRERFDRDQFIKNLLLDNLLLVDIYNRSKKLHVDVEARRVAMVVELGFEKSGDELDRVRSVIGTNPRDFVTAVDEQNIIIVKDLGLDGGKEEIEKTAQTVIDAFADNPEGTSVRVSYGTIVDEIKEVSRSYKEAMMALDVGKIFFADKNIIAYSVLGIGRLIYQLPLPLCKMFISEIFGDRSPDDFDEETITTINKFFENSLNVSETSRQLYIHRNTLVYRLDKLQRTTGLDLRVFDDAITFKIALMVVEYMKYMEDQSF